MLPFTDSRWDVLDTVYDTKDFGVVSILADEWWASCGFDQERDRYNLLMRQVVHQGSITASAYALVPYLVTLCKDKKTQFDVEYLTDVGWIEMSRIAVELRPPPMPDFLRDDYMQAMEVVPDLVDEAIDAHDSERTELLRAVKPAVHGNWRLAWKQWTGREFETIVED